MEPKLKKLKKIIIILFILITILIISIIIALFFLKKENNNNLENNKPGPSTPIKEEARAPEKRYEVVEVDNKITYYAVKYAIGRYANNLVNGDTEAIYSMLEEEYIEKNNITKENVMQFVESLEIEGEIADNFNLKTNIDNMYQLQKENTNVIAYLVNGSFNYYNVQEKTKNFSIIIQTDILNNACCIIPTNGVLDKYKNENDFSTFEVKKQKIEKNDYNLYKLQGVNDETLVFDHVNKYNYCIKNDIEKAYNSLDKEYREKRFKTLDNFKSYVEKNKKDILSFNISEFKKEKDGDITRYICKDKYDNYYIFEETAVMNYKLKLDTYTIESENFKNTYDSASSNSKVAMNIQKWFLMLNSRDYEAAYNVLDETFRDKEFGTEEEFENYMRKKYPSYYDVNIKDVKKESNAYVGEVRITKKGETDIELDQIGENNNIIVQLKENREFAMSLFIGIH